VLFLAAVQIFRDLFQSRFFNSPCHETPKTRWKKNQEKKKKNYFFFGAAADARHFRHFFFNAPPWELGAEGARGIKGVLIFF
jgi:hypothetical protein